MDHSNLSGPMSYLHLNLLADILYHDSVELESEFNTKMEFIRAQEQSCLKNAIILMQMNDFIDTMKGSLMMLEMELKDNEMLLIKAENMLSQLERKYAHLPDGTQNKALLTRSTYLNLLDLLISVEKAAANCNTIREEVEEYNTLASEKETSLNLIGQIMNFHVYTLNNLEKKINLLERKLAPDPRDRSDRKEKVVPTPAGASKKKVPQLGRKKQLHVM